MPEIQSPEPGRKLQQRYNLVGSTPSPFLSPELVPVVLVDDLSKEESLDEPFERQAVQFSTESGAAGFYSEISLTNPTSSGVLLLCDSFSPNATQGFLHIGFFTGPGGVSTTFREWRDNRISGTPICGLTNSQTAAPPSGAYRQFVTTANNRIYSLPYILEEGSRLIFTTSGTNEFLQLTVFWRERTL